MSKLSPARPTGKGASAPVGKKSLQSERGEDLAGADPSFLVCGIDPYPQVEPGEYELYCDEAKVYLDPGLKVWKCRYRFRDLLRLDFPVLYGFINLGKENKQPGRRSRYFHEWTIANGHPPAKRQRMPSYTFRGKFFVVWVDWVQARQHDGKLHTLATRYSLVKQIRALACSGTKEKSPSIEVHKAPSKEGLGETPCSEGYGG
jgi:hypothetical protein